MGTPKIADFYNLNSVGFPILHLPAVDLHNKMKYLWRILHRYEPASSQKCRISGYAGKCVGGETNILGFTMTIHGFPQ